MHPLAPGFHTFFAVRFIWLDKFKGFKMIANLVFHYNSFGVGICEKNQGCTLFDNSQSYSFDKIAPHSFSSKMAECAVFAAFI